MMWEPKQVLDVRVFAENIKVWLKAEFGLGNNAERDIVQFQLGE